MCKRTTQRRLAMLLASGLAGSFVVTTTLAAQQTHEKSSAAQPSGKHAASPYHVTGVPQRSKEYIQSAWGVNDLTVHLTASGNLIRFSYRVTDPARARLLGDNRAVPFMFGQRSHALLHVPVMEKVGQLRQTGVPEAGKEYWMVFSNKGSYVKLGDRVNVVIGTFHADGLMVE